MRATVISRAFGVLVALALFSIPASAQSTAVNLAWNPSTNTDVAGYQVDYGVAPGVYSQSVRVGPQTEFTVTPNWALSPTYYFVVRAYDLQNRLSAASNEISYTLGQTLSSNSEGVTHAFVRHAQAGTLAMWRIQGTSVVPGEVVGPGSVDTNWRVAGSGDFNGDGQRDLVWQHTDGWIAVWLLEGTHLLESRLMKPDRVVDTDWRIAAVGDMNKDGKSDLIWQHVRNGHLAVWFMDGTSQGSAKALSPFFMADTDWRIVGAADFNDDRSTDLVWRHRLTGKLAVWYMNGETRVNGDGLYPNVTDPAWTVAAIADINDDSRPDILWQHTDGRLGVWIRNAAGLTTGSASAQAVVDSLWRIVAIK